MRMREMMNCRLLKMTGSNGGERILQLKHDQHNNLIQHYYTVVVFIAENTIDNQSLFGFLFFHIAVTTSFQLPHENQTLKVECFFLSIQFTLMDLQFFFCS
eukprot:TRINITY_DN18505_c0_g1_i1.p2 TRINITY_DN18505_c0_g1~~TRINITY_DN18505_c0_g1_i1.p2  ORF type:complete len:101 (-),score=6.45 TRINITY_DN18505_c0_g1_i1:96-398(-)